MSSQLSQDRFFRGEITDACVQRCFNALQFALFDEVVSADDVTPNGEPHSNLFSRIPNSAYYSEDGDITPLLSHHFAAVNIVQLRPTVTETPMSGDGTFRALRVNVFLRMALVFEAITGQAVNNEWGRQLTVKELTKRVAKVYATGAQNALHRFAPDGKAIDEIVVDNDFADSFRYDEVGLTGRAVYDIFIRTIVVQYVQRPYTP